jgi:hypothetical protein
MDVRMNRLLKLAIRRCGLVCVDIEATIPVSPPAAMREPEKNQENP